MFKKELKPGETEVLLGEDKIVYVRTYPDLTEEMIIEMFDKVKKVAKETSSKPKILFYLYKSKRYTDLPLKVRDSFHILQGSIHFDVMSDLSDFSNPGYSSENRSI